MSQVPNHPHVRSNVARHLSVLYTPLLHLCHLHLSRKVYGRDFRLSRQLSVVSVGTILVTSLDFGFRVKYRPEGSDTIQGFHCTKSLYGQVSWER